MDDNEKKLEVQNAETLGPQIDPDQLELELDIPKTLRSEFNFLKFPFFDLAKDSQRSKIKIEESGDTKEGKFRIFWLVTRDIESRFPGDFEKRLYRAIEQVINVIPKPITNPIRLGSMRYIAKLMGIYADSGKNYQDIQRAFKNMVKASIEAEGSYQLKESTSKRYIKDTFHLYDRVIFKGEELPNRETSDCVYLMLGSWYLNNINNNYVVPLDWRFYSQLTGSITTRMYEYLSIYFYTALERDQIYYDVRYYQICSYFPLTRQYPRWKARKQLKHAHDSLIKLGYFTKVEWIETTNPHDWRIRYWIGSKAKEEYEYNKNEIRRFGAATLPVPIPDRRRRGKQIEGSQKPSNGPRIANELMGRGLTQKVAQKLSESHSESYIAHKIEVFDCLGESESSLVAKNPAGFLRKSIEDDYADPAAFISKEKQQGEYEKAAELKKQQEWNKKVDDYKFWFESKPEHKVSWDLRHWEKGYKNQHAREPTSEETKFKQEQLIKNLPSNEQMQIQILGKVIFKENCLELIDKKNKLNVDGEGKERQ